LRGHSDGILVISLSSDNKILASGGLDGNVKVWNF